MKSKSDKLYPVVEKAFVTLTLITVVLAFAVLFFGLTAYMLCSLVVWVFSLFGITVPI